MAQMGSAGKSDQGAVRAGFLGEEGFGLSCDEKEGQHRQGDDNTEGRARSWGAWMCPLTPGLSQTWHNQQMNPFPAPALCPCYNTVT